MPLTIEDALQLARDAYSASSTYFDNSIRTHIEAAIRQFRSEHPQGSKYRSAAYATRSKLFRPKTRSMVTRAEATAAEAFFSTQDTVTILPEDEDDIRQRVSADVNKRLLEYRLSGRNPRRCIPWFMTLIGAYQESYVNGVVISRQFWEYDKAKDIDRPAVKLLPIENFRFDPNAEWVDPINTSPYLIELMPMFAKDVRARAQAGYWRPVTDSQLLVATTQAKFDSTRQTREGPQRTDPRQNPQAITDYTIVWVHRNICEWNGKDYVFYTLGTEELLSPAPRDLRDEVWHGRRDYAMGFSALEAHRVYPAGPVLQTKDLQAGTNDIVNLRLDNVKFILNKRYFVRRNAQVDIPSLTRNSVGSATLMKDPDKDVKVIDFNDVTGSAYQEQDRMNADFDEVSGSFSGSSVQTNRRLNETVGGMNILAADSNQVGNYRLRTFVETWVEPVLTQLVDLEQKYESDKVVLAIAGRKSALYQRYSDGAEVAEFLEQNLNVSVNVGFGPTNPQFQLERFMNALRLFKEILQDAVLRDAGIDVDEIKKEIFGKLGYRDGRRFFIETDNPEVQTLTQEIQRLEAALAAKESPEERAAKVDKLRAETRKVNAEAEKVELELASLGAGENPQVAALQEQLATLQQEGLAKEQEWERERDALELRLADRSEEIDAGTRREENKARLEAEAKVELARLDKERASELKGFQEKLSEIQRSVEKLAATVQEVKTTNTGAGEGTRTAPAPVQVHVHQGVGRKRTVSFQEGPDGKLTGTVEDDEGST